MPQLQLFLGITGVEAAVLCANNIFSIDNVEKALDGGYKNISQAIKNTKEIGTKMFENISEGVRKIANTVEDGTTFLCGVLKMFTDRIVDEIKNLGAPEKKCNDIKENVNIFNTTIIVMYPSAIKQKDLEGPQSQSLPNMLTNNIGSLKAASQEISEQLPKQTDIGVSNP